MNQLMFTIYDVKSEAFLSPFFAKTDGEAERMVLEAARDGKSMLAKYPLDYRLIKIGAYDTVSGTVTPLNHYDLGTVHQLIKVEEARYQNHDYEASAEARNELIEPMVK